LVGPFVQGVTLDAFSDRQTYQVASFIHFLGREFPTLVLQLRTVAALPNGASRILRVKSHPAGVADAVIAIRTQSSLPLEDVPSFRQLVDAYRRHIDEIAGFGFQAYRALEDVILLAAMYDRSDVVHEMIDLARKLSVNWQMERLPHGERWLSELEARAASPAILWATAEKEIAKHRLNDVPAFNLEGVDPHGHEGTQTRAGR
jgi:hypothetical protein